jgi:hypothetical protein
VSFPTTLTAMSWEWIDGLPFDVKAPPSTTSPPQWDAPPAQLVALILA